MADIELFAETQQVRRLPAPQKRVAHALHRLSLLVRQIAEARLAGLEMRALALEDVPLKNAAKELVKASAAVEGSAIRCMMEQLEEDEGE